MSSKLARNISVLLICMALGFLAIHGARMILYFGVFDGRVSLPSVLGLSGVYIVAWLPPFGVSFFLGVLIYGLFRVHAIRWALAYGAIVGAVWLLGTTHEFRIPPGDGRLGFGYFAEQYFGTYSWYVMPLLGAVLGTYATRRLAARFRTSLER